jgi:hypothetical protein
MGMRRLKKGKQDDIPILSSNHYIYASHKLTVYLSFLLNAMLSHGCSPDALSRSTVIPIPKNVRKSLNSSDNYRGIALSSIIGKILDYIILDKYSDSLLSSDAQFGFKKGTSTTTCSFVVEEVIRYYNNNDTPVYCVMLDASKAFDCVQFIKLFRILLSKGMCPLMSRLLATLYTSQKMCVRWSGYTSETFDVTNGVKQGGVLSPILFNLYIGELLDNLSKSKVGCHIGHIFFGAFAYADDVIILAPSLLALRRLLKICDEYSIEFKVKFNATKSKLLVFGVQNVTGIQVFFNNVILKPSESELHLGIPIGPAASQARIESCVNDLYKKTNILLAQFKHASALVKYALFKTYCTSMYGCPMWDLSRPLVERVYVAWRKCVRRTLGISQRTHNDLIPYILNDTNVQTVIEKRLLNFLYSMNASNNYFVKICMRLALDGSRSPFSNSLNLICRKHNIPKF